MRVGSRRLRHIHIRDIDHIERDHPIVSHGSASDRDGYEPPIRQPVGAGRARGEGEVVCGKDDGGARGGVAEQQAGDGRATGAILLARRLIGQEQRRRRRQRAGDRHPLPLAAGQPAGTSRRPLRQAKLVEQPVDARQQCGRAWQPGQGDQCVLAHGQAVDQPVSLVHHADLAAQRGARVVVERERIAPQQRHTPRVDAQPRGQHV